MPVDTNLRLAGNEQIIDFYEALRRHALSAFDKDSVSLEMLRAIKVFCLGPNSKPAAFANT